MLTGGAGRMAARLAALAAGTFLLAGCGFAWSGDITPPPDAGTALAGLPSPTLPGGLTATLPAMTPAANPGDAAGGSFQIHGNVINGSDGAIPAGVRVSLEGLDDYRTVYTQSSALDARGAYAVTDVPLAPNRLYLASVEYNGYTFYSRVLSAEAIQPGSSVDLPVTVYDSTQDASLLVSDRLHVVLDFSPTGGLQVMEIFIISNPGRRQVTAPQPGLPVLNFRLPDGAGNLQFPGGGGSGRFVLTAEGFGDTLPVLPGEGEHQVLFAFELPYPRKAALSLALPLLTRGVMVAVPSQGVRVASPQLVDAGVRSVNGSQVRVFTGSNLPAGSVLEIDISGTPAGVHGRSSGSGLSLIIGLTALLLVGAVGVWYHRRTGKPAAAIEPAGTREGLLEEIAALDDLHVAGKLAERAYRQRRAELKENLRAVLAADTSRGVKENSRQEQD